MPGLVTIYDIQLRNGLGLMVYTFNPGAAQCPTEPKNTICGVTMTLKLLAWDCQPSLIGT